MKWSHTAVIGKGSVCGAAAVPWYSPWAPGHPSLLSGLTDRHQCPPENGTTTRLTVGLYFNDLNSVGSKYCRSSTPQCCWYYPPNITTYNKNTVERRPQKIR